MPGLLDPVRRAVRRVAAYEDNRDYYETDRALADLEAWYAGAKETRFDTFVWDGVFVPADGRVVELGGGAGQHGALFTRRFGARFCFTDLAQHLVEHAQSTGLSAQVLDALRPESLGEPIAGFVSVGLSTLIAQDAALRAQQLAAMRRALVPGGVNVIIVPRFARLAGMHTLRRAEVGDGWTIERWANWGVVPGRLAARVPERVASLLDGRVGSLFGLRRVVVLRKTA